MDTEENVKDRIIDIAIRFFLAHGFTGTSVKDLTEAAGVAKGTLYCHQGRFWKVF
jgi:AcrR family transcriptional regulator